jgi:hypothetical protein
MGFKEISQFNSTPFFATLVEQNQLQDPIFGVILAETNPELIIGGRKFNGNITYVPVTVAVRISQCVPCRHSNTDTVQGYWQTVFQRITVNGIYVQTSNNNAIIDTGVTQIIGDAADIANIYKNIPGSAQLAQSGLWISSFVCHGVDFQSSQLIHMTLANSSVRHKRACNHRFRRHYLQYFPKYLRPWHNICRVK